VPFLRSSLLVGGEGKQRTFFDGTFSGLGVSGVSLVKTLTFRFCILVIILLLLSVTDDDKSNFTNSHCTGKYSSSERSQECTNNLIIIVSDG
jgi:hypothetical protein